MSQEFESISLTRSIVTLPRCALDTQNLNLPKMSSQVSQYGTTDGANRALLDGWDNACLKTTTSSIATAFLLNNLCCERRVTLQSPKDQTIDNKLSIA